MFICGRPRKISVQRARTIAGMLGMAAASRADTNSVHTGQSWLAAAIRTAKASTAMMVVGTTIRVWPRRSTSLDICGATKALARAYVAETAPASQYSPRVCDSIATMPMGAMAIGRRAMNPAAAKPLAPGARKISE
ncbi:hypothetical protein EN974_24255 [Mesorhizobium sp. M7A.F.Ca.CA.001.12.2.1]|uniref:hypothetical protein n=1 Tax=Mesorhizobium sp. M7A.F.Ca.CA.001.12.2.1 TaxID=2496725 RepID=UPI000FCC93D2|nr:hypothetical protein [Mesorhizobium sp. M7A.F.Ca.CA.001.12.2.1]RUY94237.1 hypothetical protein EN974_24255 [Mesorhizobium sp. M7A.F.Ca.CA.001.12.2.1]